jgi:hypothetical protein
MVEVCTKSNKTTGACAFGEWSGATGHGRVLGGDVQQVCFSLVN